MPETDDIYDINNNGRTNEKVNIATKNESGFRARFELVKSINKSRRCLSQVQAVAGCS